MDGTVAGAVMPTIRYFNSMADLSLAAAELVAEAAETAMAARGRFSIVLSGGTTPLPLYRLLATPAYSDRVAWNKTLLFWGDERCVPPDHPESNFLLASQTLLAEGLVPHENILRIPAEPPPPEEAALRYQETIRTHLGQEPFDLVLLGMGNDGHVASLFPGSPQLTEHHRLVAAVPTPTAIPPLPRITMTLTALNHSRHMVVLISGKEKGELLAAISSQGKSTPYPAAQLAPLGQLTWLAAR